jgi:hypothetical protein
MGKRFYEISGERDVLSPKLQKISKESTEDRQQIYIPELRLTVYTRFNETVEETRERYLQNTYGYKGKLKALSEELQSL